MGNIFIKYELTLLCNLNKLKPKLPHILINLYLHYRKERFGRSTSKCPSRIPTGKVPVSEEQSTCGHYAVIDC